jgi:hypothetical protein
MKTCPTCGSHAINPGQNGRDIYINEHLCDVCYWRNKADDSYREGYNDGYDAGLDRGIDCMGYD